MGINRSTTSSSSTTAVGDVLQTGYPQSGFVKADGSLVNRQEYPLLFSDLQHDLPFKEGVSAGNITTLHPLGTSANSNSDNMTAMRSNGTTTLYVNKDTIFKSTDSIGWKPVLVETKNINSNNYINCIEYIGGTKWIAFGRHQTNYGFYQSTDDGDTWTYIPVNGDIFNTMYSDGTTYVFVKSGQAFVWYTTDLSNINMPKLSKQATPATINAIAKVGTVWVAWYGGSHSYTDVHYSNDLISWSSYAGGVTLDLKWSTCNGYMVIMSYNDATARPTFIYSINGSTWTNAAYSVSFSGYTNSFSGLIYDGTNYIFGVIHSTNSRYHVLPSINSPTATLVYYGEANAANYSCSAYAYANGKAIFSSGYTDTILNTAPDFPTAVWVDACPHDDYINLVWCTYHRGNFTPDTSFKKVFQCRGVYSGTASYGTTIYIEDNNGYLRPYALSGEYMIFKSSTNSPTAQGISYIQDNDTVVMLDPTGETAYAYSADHVNRTFTQVWNDGSPTLGSAMPTPTGYIHINTGTVYCYGSEGLVGSTSNTNINHVVYDFDSGVITMLGTTTDEYLKWSFDNGRTWESTAANPTYKTKAGGINPIISGDLFWYHDGMFWVIDDDTSILAYGRTPFEMVESHVLAITGTSDKQAIAYVLPSGLLFFGGTVSNASGSESLIQFTGSNNQYPTMVAVENMTICGVHNGSTMAERYILDTLTYDPLTKARLPLIRSDDPEKEWYIKYEEQ